ncbi:hypothetical protein FA95DRAFT_244159 [Auriscalpium vulgare]|uniref:Uncharacterized protein n=1 Tax=Auriscalpium vulgare TaxID=40419 RepID=A0ACB8S698_9AGAM|nr:hypothetical protein FA95DRAFT_244159 [Auriscalpium vulgare]
MESDTDDTQWEYDTVRSRALSVHGGISEDAATIRPPNAKLPASLRLLFEDDNTSSPDPYRIPGFAAGSPLPKDAILQNLAPPISVSSSATSRDRSAVRRGLVTNGSFDDGPNLSKASFAFPPRADSRGRSRLGTGASAPEDENFPDTPLVHARDRHLGVPSRGPSPTEASPAQSHLLAGRDPSRAGFSYKDVRSSKGFSDIAIPLSSTPSDVDVVSDATMRRPASRNLPAHNDIGQIPLPLDCRHGRLHSAARTTEPRLRMPVPPVFPCLHNHFTTRRIRWTYPSRLVPPAGLPFLAW